MELKNNELLEALHLKTVPDKKVEVLDYIATESCNNYNEFIKARLMNIFCEICSIDSVEHIKIYTFDYIESIRTGIGWLRETKENIDSAILLTILYRVVAILEEK